MQRTCGVLNTVAPAAKGDDRGLILVGGPSRHYDWLDREVVEQVRQIVDASFESAVKILERNQPLLEASAGELLASETLDEAALRSFFEKIE